VHKVCRVDQSDQQRVASGIRMIRRGKRHVENRRRLVGLALDAKAAVLRAGGPCLQSIVSCLDTALVVWGAGNYNVESNGEDYS
jgi:glycine cleavage system aminomethyltransferase T